MPSLYLIRDITRKYGNRTVLDIPELSLGTGRLYTLTGSNGAGKSTLLQILAFLSPPSSGKIFFRGEPVSWNGSILRKLRREVTLLHQAPYLFDTTVHANIAFGLKVRGLRGEEQRQRIEEALELVGLTDFDSRRARELSGGEAQRVAMARALALRPAVLILDEPLANVDRDTAAIMEKLILDLPSSGTTVIMTTHDPQHPVRFGSETIHLEAGRPAAPPLTMKGRSLAAQRGGEAEESNHAYFSAARRLCAEK